MKQVDNKNIYIFDEDSPVTCPECGSRTDFEELENGAQLHSCLNHTTCGLSFIVEIETIETQDEEPVTEFIKINYNNLTTTQKNKVKDWYGRPMVPAEKKYNYYFDENNNVDSATA